MRQLSCATRFRRAAARVPALIVWFLLPFTTAMAQPPRPPASTDPRLEEGVSTTLAQDRARSLGDVRYALHLVIPAERRDPVTGTVTVRFTSRAPLERLVLDFAGPAQLVRSVRLDGADVSSQIDREHIVIAPSPAMRPGQHEVSMSFTAADLALNRSDDFVYSLFVPARARYAFPCFDQPDLKAKFTLALDVPEGWRALSNTVDTAPTPPESGDARGPSTIRFDETAPLATYLFAFAAGRLSVETATRDGRIFRMFHRETDAAKVARNRDAIFDLHAAALAWLERYTGMPYPWGKFDFFLVPAFQFGGMEHPGAIFYNAPGLLLDESATTNQVLGRASLIAHETSHMWFGDLVTMRWFDDVWMKEVFANFLAAKIVNPSFPAINHEVRFLYAHYPAAYDVDRTAGTHPIRQPLDNLRDAGTLYGAIIYQKAPIVMRQLELLLGEDGLRDGLRQYLSAHQWANATWTDLIQLLDERTHGDLAAWSRIWVEDLGRPTIRLVEERESDGRLTRLRLRQDDPLGKGRLWPQVVHVALAVAGSPPSDRSAPVTMRDDAPVSIDWRTYVVRLHDAEADVPDAKGLEPVAVALAAGDGLAYGRIELDHDSRAWLLAHLPDIPDPLTRASAWVTLWDELLDGKVLPVEFVRLAIGAAPREQDELNLQRILGYTETAFWRYLGPLQRGDMASVLENTLRTGLTAAPAGAVKAAWFNALVRVATTSDTVSWLERIWRGTERIEGLTLAETDLTRLALELAVRGATDADAILETQLGRIDNPDRKARLAFIRPALSSNPEVRAHFFESLSDVAHRRREPWVVDALTYLHHPLRAAESERLVLPSLEMLETIQQTGDIFFPKRWLDATLSGHQSTRVARIVDDFLHARPNYPLRLRRIILQSADELFRAARIVGAS